MQNRTALFHSFKFFIQNLFVGRIERVLDSVAFLGAFSVVKAVYRTYKITCNTADSLKFHALAYFFYFCCLIAHVNFPFQKNIIIAILSSVNTYKMRHVGILLSQLAQQICRNALALVPAASRTAAAYNAGVSAYRVAVNRMIN